MKQAEAVAAILESYLSMDRQEDYEDTDTETLTVEAKCHDLTAKWCEKHGFTGLAASFVAEAESVREMVADRETEEEEQAELDANDPFFYANNQPKG